METKRARRRVREQDVTQVMMFLDNSEQVKADAYIMAFGYDSVREFIVAVIRVQGLTDDAVRLVKGLDVDVVTAE